MQRRHGAHFLWHRVKEVVPQEQRVYLTTASAALQVRDPSPEDHPAPTLVLASCITNGLGGRAPCKSSNNEVRFPFEWCACSRAVQPFRPCSCRETGRMPHILHLAASYQKLL